MKNQIFIIGGGNSFKNKNQAMQYFENFDIDLEWKTKSWKDWLSWSLEDYFEFIQFKRPVQDNSDYEIWKIVFEKYSQKINNLEQIFITHSLGTIFILKYLTENNFPKK
jgi:predicted alpha/beta hydrolase family esterase